MRDASWGQKLRDELRRRGLQCTTKDGSPAFLDFIQPGMTLDEVLAQEPCIYVDAQDSECQAVFQCVRGEMHYWLISERDPYRGHLADSELGAVESVELAGALCAEFFAFGGRVDLLQTRRRPNPKPSR